MTALKIAILAQLEVRKAPLPDLTLAELAILAGRAPDHDGVSGDIDAMNKEIRKRNRRFSNQFRNNRGSIGPISKTGHLARIASPLNVTVGGLTIETANDKDVLQTIHARLSKFKKPRKPTKREKRLHAGLKNERLMTGFVSIIQGEEFRALADVA